LDVAGRLVDVTAKAGVIASENQIQGDEHAASASRMGRSASFSGHSEARCPFLKQFLSLLSTAETARKICFFYARLN
jgi:hypothetical protein